MIRHYILGLALGATAATLRAAIAAAIAESLRPYTGLPTSTVVAVFMAASLIIPPSSATEDSAPWGRALMRGASAAMTASGVLALVWLVWRLALPGWAA